MSSAAPELSSFEMRQYDRSRGGRSGSAFTPSTRTSSMDGEELAAHLLTGTSSSHTRLCHFRPRSRPVFTAGSILNALAVVFLAGDLIFSGSGSLVPGNASFPLNTSIQGTGWLATEAVLTQMNQTKGFEVFCEDALPDYCGSSTVYIPPFFTFEAECEAANGTWTESGELPYAVVTACCLMNDLGLGCYPTQATTLAPVVPPDEPAPSFYAILAAAGLMAAGGTSLMVYGGTGGPASPIEPFIRLFEGLTGTDRRLIGEACEAFKGNVSGKANTKSLEDWFQDDVVKRGLESWQGIGEENAAVEHFLANKLAFEDLKRLFIKLYTPTLAEGIGSKRFAYGGIEFRMQQSYSVKIFVPWAITQYIRDVNCFAEANDTINLPDIQARIVRFALSQALLVRSATATMDQDGFDLTNLGPGDLDWLGDYWSEGGCDPVVARLFRDKYAEAEDWNVIFPLIKKQIFFNMHQWCITLGAGNKFDHYLISQLFSRNKDFVTPEKIHRVLNRYFQWLLENGHLEDQSTLRHARHGITAIAQLQVKEAVSAERLEDGVKRPWPVQLRNLVRGVLWSKD